MPSTVRVTIGFVLRAHGIKGWLRLRTDGDSVLSLPHIFVGEKSMKVLHAQRERDEFLVQLEGLNDRTAAEALHGQPVSVERDQLPPAAEDELYLSDLIGCRVYDLAGADLGEVVAVDHNDWQDLLTVQGATRWQLPFVVDQLVVSVDVAAKKIVCDPPPGLLELG